MSRNERLEHWAELLESEPDRPLATLHGTEYQAAETRATMRCAQSPISIAFDDPTLRAEGLNNDTYGEAKRFFELSDWQLHEIVCHCHFGATMTAEVAARRVRAAIAGRPVPGFLDRMRHAMGR
jgi:hypothetical protein